MYDAIDDPYTYENSTVLINLIDLRDQGWHDDDWHFLDVNDGSYEVKVLRDRKIVRTVLPSRASIITSRIHAIASLGISLIRCHLDSREKSRSSHPQRNTLDLT